MIKDSKLGGISFLHLGFRPFFFGALGFAAISMMIWMLQYTFQKQIIVERYPMIAWHAHEMIFGFSVAVIAGFLLTAVKNWTNIQTIHQIPLLIVFLLWLFARILPFVDASWAIPLLAIIDCAFILLVTIAYAYPVIKAKSWRNVSFIGAFFLLLLANIVYYLGLLGYLAKGTRIGLYLGLYVVLGVIFHLGHRVMPFFIRKALDFEVTNHTWVDKSVGWVFLIFIVADVFFSSSFLVPISTIPLVFLFVTRLVGWYHRGIWSAPLLWVIFVGYILIVLGFLLKTSSYFFHTSPFLGLHAFAYGVGMITAGMMARVSLGHTGNSVYEPPKLLSWVFAFLFVGAVLRVVFPLFLIEQYRVLVGLSQGLWILAFLILFIIYAPLLIKIRADGKYG